MATPIINVPQKLAIFSILSNPRVDTNVAKTSRAIPINPRVWLEVSPKRCHAWVVSFPKMAPEIETEMVEKFVTSQMTHAAYQIKVPINAGFSPILA